MDAVLLISTHGSLVDRPAFEVPINVLRQSAAPLGEVWYESNDDSAIYDEHIRNNLSKFLQDPVTQLRKLSVIKNILFLRASGLNTYRSVRFWHAYDRLDNIAIYTANKDSMSDKIFDAKGIYLYLADGSVKDISHDIKRVTRSTNTLHLSEILNYLAENNLHNIVYIDHSCSWIEDPRSARRRRRAYSQDNPGYSTFKRARKTNNVNVLKDLLYKP